MEKRKRKQVVNMTIDGDVINAAREQARAENRSLSNLVETILQNYIRQGQNINADKTL